MPDAVWTTIDRELGRLKPKRTWADLARHLGVTDQVVNNWSRRRVPAERYTAIAAWLGMTVEELLAGGRVGGAAEQDKIVIGPLDLSDDLANAIQTEDVLRLKREIADRVKLLLTH